MRLVLTPSPRETDHAPEQTEGSYPQEILDSGWNPQVEALEPDATTRADAVRRRGPPPRALQGDVGLLGEGEF